MNSKNFVQNQFGDRSSAGNVKALSAQPLIIQRKLNVGKEDDEVEKEADASADQVMRMPESGFVQRNCEECEKKEKLQRKAVNQVTPFLQAKTDGSTAVSKGVSSSIQSSRGNGASLDGQTQSFMGSRLGSDFSSVKIHTDNESVQINRNLNAKAFTVGNDVYFNEGQYQPGSADGKQLLAHELTHVVQQRSSSGIVQRVVELRPPGRGEASAFERRQDIVDRLNRLSRAVRYSLNERVLQYELIKDATQTYFDRQMIALIDSESVLPLRLITGRGLVGDRVSGFSSLLVDSFMTGYFDLEDMMRSDDTSFQMNILHILTERSRARNYARRIGTPGLSPIDATGASTPEFRRAHQAGIDSELSFLQDIFSDPTIRFVRERVSGDNLIFTFRSAERYRIVHTFRRRSRTVSGGTVVVIDTAGENVSVTDFIRQRQEAATAAALETL